MKLYNQHTLHYLCLMLLFLIASTAHAQNGTSKNTADSTSAKIAKKLSVSPEKAKQIQAAYNYNHDAIIRLMKDTTFKGVGKMRLLKKLQAERKHKIDSAVTPEQQAAMIADQGSLHKKQMEIRAQMIKRHEDEMNRIPHKRTVKTVAADTTKNKPKTKTN